MHLSQPEVLAECLAPTLTYFRPRRSPEAVLQSIIACLSIAQASSLLTRALAIESLGGADSAAGSALAAHLPPFHPPAGIPKQQEGQDRVKGESGKGEGQGKGESFVLAGDGGMREVGEGEGVTGAGNWAGAVDGSGVCVVAGGLRVAYPVQCRWVVCNIFYYYSWFSYLGLPCAVHVGGWVMHTCCVCFAACGICAPVAVAVLLSSQ